MEIPSDWDAWLVAQGPGAGFCQTSIWAEIHAAVNRARSFVLTVDDGSGRRAGMLASLRPGVSPRASVLARLRAHLAGYRAGTLECFEGPVLLGPDRLRQLAELLTRVDELAQQLGIRRVRFAGKPVAAVWGVEDAIAAVFARFGYRAEPWVTALVDLEPPEADLLARMRQAARKGIRKSLEAGLRVIACESYDDYVRDFREPYADAVAAETGTRPNLADGPEWWAIDGGRHYRYLVAKDPSGRVHATLGTYAFNGVATEIMSGRTPAGREANLPAQDLLHWEAFRIHKAAGDRYFNLAGYSPSPKDAKEAGIRRFKEKWGGREIPVPQFIRGESPALVRIARRLMRAAVPDEATGGRA